MSAAKSTEKEGAKAPSNSKQPSLAVAGDRLKSFVERVERLEEEKRALAEDIKEVYSEAKSVGFDVKIIRMIVRIRRMDADDLAEQNALLDTYMHALQMT